MNTNRLVILAVALSCTRPASTSVSRDGEWPVYGRDAAGTRFSPLRQVTPANVESLTVAWTYRTRETEPEFAAPASEEASLEVTPLVVDGTMYISTPLGRVMALDPATGTERWVFDAKIDRTIEFGDFTSRGVATWLDASAPSNSTCLLRFIVPCIYGRLKSLVSRDG